MNNMHKIALGSTLLLFSLTIGIIASAQGFFESEIILNSFQEPVTITPAGQAGPITPSQGMALSPGSEVVTEEGASANVAFNCKVNVPAGSGLVVGASGAAECIDGTANIQEADQVVANPAPCEEPIATITGGPGVFVNGTPASGPVDLCPGDSVVGQVQIVYGCTVDMGENSRLQINDYSDCAEGRMAVAAAGSGAVGSGSAAAGGGAAVGGGAAGVGAGTAIVGGALVTSIFVGVANDDDDDDGIDDGGPPSPSQP